MLRAALATLGSMQYFGATDRREPAGRGTSSSRGWRGSGGGGGVGGWLRGRGCARGGAAAVAGGAGSVFLVQFFGY